NLLLYAEFSGYVKSAALSPQRHGGTENQVNNQVIVVSAGAEILMSRLRNYSITKSLLRGSVSLWRKVSLGERPVHILQTDAFVVAAHDPVPNLLHGFSLSPPLIGVKRLLHASSAMRVVVTLEAGVQTRVSGRAVAETVAGELIQNAGYLCCCLVRAALEIILQVHLV